MQDGKGGTAYRGCEQQWSPYLHTQGRMTCGEQSQINTTPWSSAELQGIPDPAY